MIDFIKSLKKESFSQRLLVKLYLKVKENKVDKRRIKTRN